MTETKLSSEEVDALLNASKHDNQDLDKIVGNNDAAVEALKNNAQSLSSINDLTRIELEKELSNFFRNKIFVKSNIAHINSVAECFSNEKNDNIYTAFRLMPLECYGIFNINNAFIHQTINILYGGKVNQSEKIIEQPGKIGMMFAEKITQIFLDAFIHACREYGTINYELLKTTTHLPLAFNYGIDTADNAYLIEYSVLLSDVENKIKFIISSEFFDKFFAKQKTISHKQKDFWRSMIKDQVTDSMVNIHVSLPDVAMHAKDLLNLKEGDIIPISDPTTVFICLNNYKLFRASAGQANAKIVVKVIEQI